MIRRERLQKDCGSAAPARTDPSGGYRPVDARGRALGGVRLPSVYYTEAEADAAARAWRGGTLPFPAAPMRREMSAFVKRSWRELRTLVPPPCAMGARKDVSFAAFWNGSDYANLGHYAVLSEDFRAANLLRDLTDLLIERYLTWPLLPGARPGVDYAGRLGQWQDSVLLLRAARAVWSLRMLGVADRAWIGAFLEGLARPILEINALPALEYRHDKYHNAMTDALEAVLLAGWLGGRSLRVRDVVDGRRAWNGEELVEYAWGGPKGLAFFIANAFDEGGVYWELSHTYKLHCLHQLLPMLQLGRLQGRTLPKPRLERLGEAVWETVCGIFPDGSLPPWSETHPGRNIGAPVVETGAWLTGDARLRNMLPRLDQLRQRSEDPQSRFWGRFVHRLFHPAARPGPAPASAPAWNDHLHVSSGQLLARSREGSFAVHVNWDAHQDYHSDFDALAFCVQHLGRLRLWDPGYHSGANPYRFWTRRTASHSTASVNDEDQAASFRAGEIESFVSSVELTWIQISAPHLYARSGVTRYRRSLLIFKTAPYVLVDVFEIEGGWRHRLHLLGLGEARAAGKRPVRCVWRDRRGWAAAEAFGCGRFDTKLERVFPPEARGPRKLVLTRTAPAPLSSVFATVIAFGEGRVNPSRARVVFAEDGVTVRLPSSPSRGAARAFIARSGASALELGGRRRTFAVWKGEQAAVCRPVLLSADAIEGPWTIRTEVLACWPLERGMALRLNGRRYALDAWQFSEIPLRLPVAGTAFEPRRIRLRFTGTRPFRASDRGAVAWLQPTKLSATIPSRG
ncbi:MAG: heparinase II/III family protein [Verrucomicrobiae bacterium]|nr:heparinase II/III family protein [Verrucomicrobiae bacterium]